MEVCLLCHVMDALLSSGIEASELRKYKKSLRVKLEFYSKDRVVNSSLTSMCTGKGLSFDSKLKLELLSIKDVKQIYDEENGATFFVRFCMLYEEPSGRQVELASAAIPTHNLAGKAPEPDCCFRREHIINLLNCLGGSDVFARLRVGLLIVTTNSEVGQNGLNQFFEQPTKQKGSHLAKKDLPKNQNQQIEKSIDKREYEARVKAGSNVLMELQSLAERLDSRESTTSIIKPGELLIPASVFVEFLRTRVSTESSRDVLETLSIKNGSSGGLGFAGAPDTLALLEGGLSKTGNSFFLSSAAVFVARRMRVSTGATAKAETMELRSDLTGLQAELELISKETTELQLFFAKEMKPAQVETPIHELDMKEFGVLVERSLVEIESCITSQWGSPRQLQIETQQEQDLVEFFLSKLGAVSSNLENKSDEIIRKLQQLVEGSSKPKIELFQHLSVVREFRKRVKIARRKLTSLLSPPKSHSNVDSEEEMMESKTVEVSEMEQVAERVINAFNMRIRSRSLATLQRSTINEILDQVQGKKRVNSFAVSPQNDFSAVIRVVQRLGNIVLALIGSYWKDTAVSMPSPEILGDIMTVLHKVTSAVSEFDQSKLCCDIPEIDCKAKSFLSVLQKLHVPLENENQAVATPVLAAVFACSHVDNFLSSVTSLAPNYTEESKLLTTGLTTNTDWAMARDAFLVLALMSCDGTNLKADDAKDVLQAISSFDGVQLMLLAFCLVPQASHQRSISALEFADVIGSIFCDNSSLPLSPLPQDKAAECENSVLARAFLLIRRCQMLSVLKVPLTESQILTILDNDPSIESHPYFSHGKTLLHLVVESPSVQPLLLKVLLSRKKISPEQVDDFGRTPVMYCARRPDLMSVFLESYREPRKTTIVFARRSVSK